MGIETHVDKFKVLFIYFWGFSLFGHYLELIWKNYIYKFGWQPILPTIMPLAPPYGLGVVAIILFIEPLIKKTKLNPLIIFVLCTGVSVVVEYFCAVFLVTTVGYNKFWNYSYEPFNINGYVCLRNAFTFGLSTTFFLYLIYPFCEKFFKSLPKHQLNLIFWIIFLSFILNLTTLNLR